VQPMEMKEISTIKKIFLQKTIADHHELSILLSFLEKVQTLLKGQLLTESEKQFIFQKRFELIASDGIIIHDKIALIPDFLRDLPSDPLPLNLSIRCFRILQAALKQTEEGKRSCGPILRALAILSSQQQFPEKLKSEYFDMIKFYTQNYERYELLIAYVNSETCPQKILSDVFAQLLHALDLPTTHLSEKRYLIKAIRQLNYPFANLNFTFTEILLSILSNPDLTALYTEVTAALIAWIRTPEPLLPFCFTTAKKLAFEDLIDNLRKCPSVEICNAMINIIFAPGDPMTKETPHAFYFFNTLLTLVNEERLHPDIRIALSQRMIENLNGCQMHMRLTVLYMILERLHFISCPRSIKKLYVKTLAENLDAYSQVLQDNQFPLRSIEDLINLDPIKNSPELFQIAQKTGSK
jgi:hypothetical protein